MRVLVTGCAGFIGSTVTEALLARGDEVTGIDSFDDLYPPVLKRANLVQALASPGFRILEGDIRDECLVARAMEAAQPDAIIHLAALAGVRSSLERPREYASVNADGTVVLLEAARSFGVPRFVFGSSSSVYGATCNVPFTEDEPIGRPLSPYAASKIAAEAFCYSYHHLYGTRMAVLRFFTVYGPRQRPDLAINKFVRLMLAGKPIPMYGDGSMRRDYTYVTDIAAGVLAAMDADFGYEAINLGGSSPVTLSGLIATIAAVLGCEPVIDRLPEQPGDVPCTYANIEKAERLLQWRPQVPLTDGLRQSVDWFRATATVA
jgi:UDP-glucuronate 4-epimerase